MNPNRNRGSTMFAAPPEKNRAWRKDDATAGRAARAKPSRSRETTARTRSTRRVEIRTEPCQ